MQWTPKPNILFCVPKHNVTLGWLITVSFHANSRMTKKCLRYKHPGKLLVLCELARTTIETQMYVLYIIHGIISYVLFIIFTECYGNKLYLYNSHYRADQHLTNSKLHYSHRIINNLFIVYIIHFVQCIIYFNMCFNLIYTVCWS